MCKVVGREVRRPAAPRGKESNMGLLDSVKGLLGGNKKAIQDGIDKAVELVQSKTPDNIDGQVAKGADMAKGLLNQLTGSDEQPAASDDQPSA
jgi:hypothetical protein